MIFAILTILDILVAGIGAGILLFFGSAFMMSLREQETAAARRFLATGIILALPYSVSLFFDYTGNAVFQGVLVLLPFTVVILMVLPLHKWINTPMPETPLHRIDERDIMFSRAELVPGTPRFKAYYQHNPHLKKADDLFRSRPGLLSAKARFADPLLFAAARSLFESIEQLHPLVNAKPAGQRIESTPEQWTRFIKAWSKKLGANRVGITHLKSYHLYSVKGRGKRYGESIELNAGYAIALTVEMDHEMIRCAPRPPALLESAQQYFRAGAIAVQLAQMIGSLGYEATAHIDAMYEVVCPLVARDAGLGEIGRMGLLMTPNLGPRVRISAVTTNLPLEIDNRQQDTSIIDFCRHCFKCAKACPSNAISFDDMEKIDGVLRWQINSEACYTYWCSTGTDCGRCIAVCPYSHPDTLLHNAFRYGIRHSLLFRKGAILLDDLYYNTSFTSWSDSDET